MEACPATRIFSSAGNSVSETSTHQTTKSPLVADASSSTRCKKIVATSNVRKSKRGQAITVVEVNGENSLSADLTRVQWDDRRGREAATADHLAGDQDIVIRQARQRG